MDDGNDDQPEKQYDSLNLNRMRLLKKNKMKFLNVGDIAEEDSLDKSSDKNYSVRTPNCNRFKYLEEHSETIKEFLAKLTNNPEIIENRVAHKFIKKLIKYTDGYSMNIDEILFKSNLIEVEQGNKTIEYSFLNSFISLCSKHCMPFTGIISIGYDPVNLVIHEDSLSRLIKYFTQRLQSPSLIMNEIFDCLNTQLKPDSIAIILQMKTICCCDEIDFFTIDKWELKNGIKGDYILESLKANADYANNPN